MCFFPCFLQGESEFCLLLALPCGRDQDDVLNQTQALRTAFINYLQAKLAAGIINVPNPGSNQVSLSACYCRCLSVFANIQLLLVFDNFTFTYSGAKKYLVSHQLCKFSHLKR